jgi:hypothetical protein
MFTMGRSTDMHRTIAVGALATLAIGASGCGSSDKSNSTSAPSGTPAQPAAKKPQSRTYKVKLTGKAEVPKGSSKGSGTAVISIRGKSNQLCWKFKGLKGVTAPSAAHIHQGPAGTSGPIVVPLGGAYTASGCTSASAALLSKIVAAPKQFYVNVHNAKFPNGAVRAQL